MDRKKSVNRLFFFLFFWGMFLPGIVLSVYKQMDISLLAAALELFGYLLPAVLFLLLKKKSFRTCVPFQKVTPQTIAASVFTGILLVFISAFLNFVSMLFVKNHAAASPLLSSNHSFWIDLLAIAVIPAISEEMMLRGIFYQSYKDDTGSVIPGIIGSSLVFGMLHGNFAQFFYTAVSGLILCLLVEITGSIVSSMLAHFTVNSWTVVLLHFGSAEEETEVLAEGSGLVLQFLEYFGLAVAAAAVLAGLFYRLMKRCGKEEHIRQCLKTDTENGRIKSYFSFVTPIFAITAVFSLFWMIFIESAG